MHNDVKTFASVSAVIAPPSETCLRGGLRMGAGAGIGSHRAKRLNGGAVTARKRHAETPVARALVRGNPARNNKIGVRKGEKVERRGE